MKKYNSCSKPPTSQKIEVNPKLVVSKSHPYVLDVLGNLAITDSRWQSANVHLKSWQRDVREYKNNHLLWEKIWSSYGDSSECGHFLGYIQNLLGSNPQKFPAVSRSGKEGNFATESLGAPTLWHRMFRTILEMDTIVSWQRLWKDCEKKHFLWKKSRVELTFCCPCVSWKNLLDIPDTGRRADFSLNGSIKSPGQTQPPPGVQEPRPPRIGDPFVGLFRQSQSPMISAPLNPEISWQLRGSQCPAFKNACELLWTDNQNMPQIVVCNGKKSGTQRGRNDDVFFSSIPSSWLECRLLSQ